MFTQADWSDWLTRAGRLTTLLCLCEMAVRSAMCAVHTAKRELQTQSALFSSSPRFIFPFWSPVTLFVFCLSQNKSQIRTTIRLQKNKLQLISLLIIAFFVKLFTFCRWSSPVTASLTSPTHVTTTRSKKTSA